MKQTNENGVIKTRNRKSLAELRSPRQKFIARWRREFPWLQPNRADESIGLCTICNQELVCKTSHLDRHQKTFKHTRLGQLNNRVPKFEILPEADLIEAHTTGYLDSEFDYTHHDETAFDDVTLEYTTIKVEPLKICDPNEICPIDISPKEKSPVKKRRKVKAKVESPLMFEAIETTEFEPSFNSTSRRPVKVEQTGLNNSKRSECEYYYMHPPPPVKDSFDLFFESVSATVKSFPPKLAAELKGRVSQLITEFELRSICEKEAQEKAAESISQQSVTVLAGSVMDGDLAPGVVVKIPRCNLQPVDDVLDMV